MMSRKKSKFVNGNRTPEERKALYCMLRKVFNMSTPEARIIVAYRKSVQIRVIQEGGISDRL